MSKKPITSLGGDIQRVLAAVEGMDSEDVITVLGAVSMLFLVQQNQEQQKKQPETPPSTSYFKNLQ